jgi:lactobin A/cerein 7B family class IIb bacteriocin
VHEEPAGSWHIVLPARPADAGELSEEDLEKVAGGTTPVATAIILGTAILTGSAAWVTKREGGW